MADIKQKTKVGMLWNVIEKIVVQLISFALNVILARLLTPHDYGTIGMLTIFLTFSNVFIDSGFSRALVQKQDRTESDFSTVLIFNILMSCVLYAILFFASPAIAKFYKTPELLSLQRVFFLVIILNSLTVVQNAKFQIHIDFKKIAIINTVTTLLGGIIGIIAAYQGLGPWALVIQTLSKSLLNLILFWILGKWLPKTGFSKQSFKQLFTFGSKLLLSGLLGTTVTNINNLVIGKVYTPSSLGLYTRAQQFPDLLTSTLTSVLNNATFPLMSSLQSNKDELVTVLKRLIKINSMFVFPAMTGLAILSKPLILVLLGEKWEFTADLLVWLCFSNMFVAHNTLNMNVLNAIGRSDLFLKVDCFKIPIIFITMAITFPISLKAVVVGKVVSCFIYFYINAFMPGKLFGFGAFKQLACSWKYIVSTLVMSVFVLAVRCIIDSSIVCLVVGIVFGVIVYAVMILLLRDDEAKLIVKKIKGKFVNK